MQLGKNRKITSVSNPEIKQVVRLRQRRFREQAGVFLIEGHRELLKALEAGFSFKKAYICPSVVSNQIQELIDYFMDLGVNLVEVSAAVFEKIALRENTTGIVAIAEVRRCELAQLPVEQKSLVLIVDGVEKPGNLGALLRTADAAAVAGVILTNSLIDCFNPNVIRSSLGTVFCLPVIEASVDEVRSYCSQNEIQIVAAMPQAKHLIYELMLVPPTAVLLGSESSGLHASWQDAGELKAARIPMSGKVDSLNVSVAGAIMVYEAVRQRLGV